jgi:alanine racemase
MRTSRVLISSSALKSNYQKIANHISPSVVVPVVKANAYGHGLTDVVNILQSVGANFFATAFIDEAIQIRKSGFNGRLLSLGSYSAQELCAAEGLDIEIVCYSLESIDLVQANCKTGQKVHLKIDTGMCRLGVWFSEVDEFFNRAKSADKVKVVAVCTHFAKSESSR